MSWERYVESVCPEGHYWVKDGYESEKFYYGEVNNWLGDMYKEEHICPTCGQARVWMNTVDLTIEKCPHCGHLGTKEPTRYKIPNRS